MSVYRDKYILGYMKKRELITPDLKSHINQQYLRRFLICIILYLFPRERGGQGTHEKKLSKKSNIAIYKPAKSLVDVDERLFAIKTIGGPSFGKNNFSIHKLFFYLYLYLYVSKGFVRRYRSEVLKLREALRNMNYLILNSDGLPLARAILSSTYGLKTKSICVQHGTFYNSILGEIDGSKCDLNVIQNRSQEKFFKNSGANVDIIYSELLDFYECLQGKYYSTKKLVVMIGQGLYSEDKLKHQKLLLDYKEVIEILRKNGVKLRYRPHPTEYKNPLLLLKILLVLRCLPTKIIDYNFTFIGHRSTLLNSLYFRGYDVYTTSKLTIDFIPTLEINVFLTEENNKHQYEAEEWSKIFYDLYVPPKYCWRKIYDQIQE